MKAVRRPDWPAVAATLAVLIPRERLHPRVVAAAEGAPGAWAVAFSGGADSLALLLLLWAHWPRRRRSLLALHFNHRQRGRDAQADATFCRQACVRLGVRFRTAAWTKAPRGASEAASREARHGFFAREMTAARARLLWLGHQQDDIAETLLMRIARGSGLGGLAAPRPVQAMPRGRRHLRPLLTLKKAELTAALTAAGAVWREDASNASGDYLRNRLRNQVLPAWLEANAGRDALAGAALARERLEEEDVAMEAWLAELAPIDAGNRLDLRPFVGRPQALLRRALHTWLLTQPNGSALSRQGFEALLAAIRKGGDTRFSLGIKGFAIIRRHRLTYACA